MHATVVYPRTGSGGAWRATLAATCATLLGVGLARFAYSPLIPPLIAEHWLSPAQADYLAAANLAGYLAGALCARWMTRLASAAIVLRLMMVLATAAFFACANPLSFLWFFVWRFAAGLSGAALMVIAAPTVLPQVPLRWRGLASGVIFSGVGLGIAISGTLVPLLLRWGLVATWCGLGVLALLLTAVALPGWPKQGVEQAEASLTHPQTASSSSSVLRMLYVEYGLNAVGLVPHMIFLVDFIARGLGRGIGAGASYWILFGASAMAGPIITGHAGDRFGFRPVLRTSFLIQAAAAALMLWSNEAALIASTIVIGAFVPGVVPLAYGRIQELLPDKNDSQRAAWSTATVAFALGQAAGAYGLSFLFVHTDSYMPLFTVATAALVLAFAIDLLDHRKGAAITVRRSDR